MMLAQQAAQLDTNTLISVGTVLVLIGASWRLSALLTRIDARLERLDKMPERMTAVEGHVRNLEIDVSNLWAAYRGDDPRNSRGERGPYSSRPRTHDNPEGE